MFPESKVTLIALAVLTTACGSTGLSPAAYPDSTVPCPAGFGAWKLEVLDRRVRREGSEGVQSLVSESIRRSFPGCRWNAEASEKAASARGNPEKRLTVAATASR